MTDGIKNGNEEIEIYSILAFSRQSGIVKRNAQSLSKIQDSCRRDAVEWGQMLLDSFVNDIMDVSAAGGDIQRISRNPDAIFCAGRFR